VSPQLVALAQVRVDAAERGARAAELLWTNGAGTIYPLIDLARAEHAAFVEGSVIGDARVVWATKNLDRAKRIEAEALKLKQAGASSADVVEAASLARAEAEFWLEEAREVAPSL
jgi:hypothetical protein